jgi:two-component system chemotaxis response regulator CheB
LFARSLSQAKDIELVGDAEDPYAARDRIIELRPDVLVLDVEMPRMDGIEFLRRLMQHFPMPVVICSSAAVAGGEIALRALRAGAIEVICKPNEHYLPAQFDKDLIAAVRSAAAARGRVGAVFAATQSAQSRPEQLSPSLPPKVGAAHGSARAGSAGEQAVKHPSHCKLIAIGASTGGTIAVDAIVRALPPVMPPIIIVQHMPAYITGAFAHRLNQVTNLQVEEARDGSVLRPGLILVAPGGVHVVIERVGIELRASLREGPRVNGHIPSVDVMFRSVAYSAGAAAVGVLLTGMGRDGADGLLAMREAGAHTLAQDEASSVVWGMPKAAIDIEAVDDVVPLQNMAAKITRIANSMSHATLERRVQQA